MTTTSQLREIDFPDLEVIGEAAFLGCKSLSSANIPNVQSIGDEAFSRTGLISAWLPKLKKASTPFNQCSCLQKIQTSPGNEDMLLLAESSQLSDVGIAMVSMPEGMVCWASIPCCPEKLRLPPQAKKIDNGVFNDIQKLQAIDLGSVSCIHTISFLNCPCLSSVCLSSYDGVVQIEDFETYKWSLFSGCMTPVKVIVSLSLKGQYESDPKWDRLVAKGLVEIVPDHQPA